MEQYNKILLGHVGVDSGQLLLCDPCYIQSEWEQEDFNDEVPKHNFSYNACSNITLNEEGGGQLKYKMGHEGVGVAFSTGIGDGFYPVFQNFDEAGNLISVEVVFQFPEDLEENEN
jgi:hypothetical protein